MDLGISGRTAIVTGSASGIGHGIVKLLATEGVKTALWDVSDSVTEVAKAIAAESGVESLGRVVDITAQEQIDLALDQTTAELGDVDILVHSAAIGSGKFGFPFTNLTPDDWSRVIEVNVLGMTRVAHAVAPRMRERGSGSMVFIASVAGQIGSPTDPPYSASKAANINFAQCMAKDLAPHGVRVNVVCPGMVSTPLNQSIWRAFNEQQPEDQRVDFETWFRQKVENVVPLRSWQEPEDIANMVAFLASPRAAQVTGQTINVDGGYVMHW